MRAAGLGVLELLEDERGTALGDDEAVAAASKGREHPLVESAVMLREGRDADRV